MRDQRYKLVRFNNLEHEFYDLVADPSGTTPMVVGNDQVATFYQLWGLVGAPPPIRAPDG